MKRVAITGVGVVSPVGSTIEEFWSALVEARTGIRPIHDVRTDKINTKLVAQVDFDARSHFPPRRLSLIDRFSQFAVVAARSAVENAGLVFDEPLALSVVTIIGTGAGGMNTLDDSFWQIYREDQRRTHPFTVPRLMANAAASQVSIDLGLKGPAFAVASACASGTHAIGLGFQMVRSGMTPVAVTGASEACLTMGTIMAWESLRVMSEDGMCRPFSKNRTGLVLGEGAAVLILEEWDHAAARGAPVIAELRGFGMSADANDAIAPDRNGAERAMSAALKDAGLDPADVGYVNAHGTGTVLNDATETLAIRGVFGAQADRLAISSNKGVLAHGLGVAGAFEAVATALTLKTGMVPPTANYQEPDPACDLDVVPNTAREMAVEAAISNSFAFGGLNAVLALGRV